MQVRGYTVGQIQENSYLVRASDEATTALIVDPGAEPERLLAEAEALGTRIAAILLTHTHYDHIGAVAPMWS